MAMALDVARLLWLLTLLAVFVLIVVGSMRAGSTDADLVARVVCMSAIIMLAAIALSALRVLNPLTLTLAAGCWPVATWAARHRRSIAGHAEARMRHEIIRWAGWLEASDWRARMTLSQQFVIGGMQRRLRGCGMRSISLLAASGLALAAIAPQLNAALTNARLSSPDAYAELVAAQQLLAGEPQWSSIRPFAAGTAALSLVSSISAVHVVRLLVPIVTAAVLLALMFLIYRITRSFTAALLGAAALWWLRPNEATSVAVELAHVFLLLAAALWHESAQGSRQHTAAVALAIALVVSAVPAMLLSALLAGGAMLLIPRIGLIVIGAGWLILGRVLNESHSAALAMSLMMVGAFHLVTVFWRCEAAVRRFAGAVAIALIATLVLVPRPAAAYFIEYDAAARKAIEIAETFPRYRVLMVGPVEQWALTYGRAWHMNLYEFVDSIGTAGRQQTWPFTVDEVFVFVEKRPFAAWAREPEHVPFSTLVDPVFRHYRSLAGRSSLQFAALAVCERLRGDGIATRIYHEDDALRIYRFTP